MKITQRKCIGDLLQRLSLHELNPTLTLGDASIAADSYGTQAGSLGDWKREYHIAEWLECSCTQHAPSPDKAFATSLQSLHLDKRSVALHQVAIRVLRYLKGSPHNGITLHRGRLLLTASNTYPMPVRRHVNRSTTDNRTCFPKMAWSSRLQAIVTLSSSETEFGDGVRMRRL
jgi:hypothetical protein